MNTKGIELIKSFEGFKAKPYLCPAGVPSIGYGSTYYENGTRVTLRDPQITEQRATELLYHTLLGVENQVRSLVRKPINENQLSALVSFTYNVGSGNLRQSNLLKKVNGNPDNPLIREEFYKWKYAKVNGISTVLPGLVRRRIAEANLYFEI
jgi:lysozyme